MLDILSKTIASILSRRILAIAAVSALGSILAFALLLGLIGWALSATSFLAIGWLETGVDVLLGAGSFVLAWFLFPAVTVLIGTLFLETVAGRIERGEYGIEHPQSRSFKDEIFNALSFIGTLIGLNLLCLPLYLIPLVNIATYYSLNAYLLGREFFDVAAARHVTLEEGKRMFKKHKGVIMLGGGLISLASTLPFVNLFAPILGVVLMTHLLQNLLQRASSA